MRLFCRILSYVLCTASSFHHATPPTCDSMLTCRTGCCCCGANLACRALLLLARHPGCRWWRKQQTRRYATDHQASEQQVQTAAQQDGVFSVSNCQWQQSWLCGSPGPGGKRSSCVFTAQNQTRRYGTDRQASEQAQAAQHAAVLSLTSWQLTAVMAGWQSRRQGDQGCVDSAVC